MRCLRLYRSRQLLLSFHALSKSHSATLFTANMKNLTYECYSIAKPLPGAVTLKQHYCVLNRLILLMFRFSQRTVTNQISIYRHYRYFHKLKPFFSLMTSDISLSQGQSPVPFQNRIMIGSMGKTFTSSNRLSTCEPYFLYYYFTEC